MFIPHIPLLFILGFAPFIKAQTASAAGGSGSIAFPPNGTVTLSANGTATATIVNGTKLTPTSTAASAFPTLSGVSVCVTNCLQSSVSAVNCSAITDVACFCPSPIFRNTTVNCVSTQCPPSELAGAESLAQQFCRLASITLTFPTTSPSSTSGSSTAAPMPTQSTGKNGSKKLRHPHFLKMGSIIVTLAWFAFDW